MNRWLLKLNFVNKERFPETKDDNNFNGLNSETFHKNIFFTIAIAAIAKVFLCFL